MNGDSTMGNKGYPHRCFHLEKNSLYLIQTFDITCLIASLFLDDYSIVLERYRTFVSISIETHKQH